MSNTVKIIIGLVLIGVAGAVYYSMFYKGGENQDGFKHYPEEWDTSVQLNYTLKSKLTYSGCFDPPGGFNRAEANIELGTVSRLDFEFGPPSYDKPSNTFSIDLKLPKISTYIEREYIAANRTWLFGSTASADVKLREKNPYIARYAFLAWLAHDLNLRNDADYKDSIAHVPIPEAIQQEADAFVQGIIDALFVKYTQNHTDEEIVHQKPNVVVNLPSEFNAEYITSIIEDLPEEQKSPFYLAICDISDGFKVGFASGLAVGIIAPYALDKAVSSVNPVSLITPN
jgi:hypothetical protein